MSKKRNKKLASTKIIAIEGTTIYVDTQIKITIRKNIPQKFASTKQNHNYIGNKDLGRGTF
jgi:hypothetical protein